MYIETTPDIKERIRHHWRNSKDFDRLLFPMGNVESPILSINSFHPLDRTKVFVYKTDKISSKEDYFINQISPEYFCNRLGRGRVTSNHNDENT